MEEVREIFEYIRDVIQTMKSKGIEVKSIRIRSDILDKIESPLNGTATFGEISTLFGLKVIRETDVDYCWIVED